MKERNHLVVFLVIVFSLSIILSLFIGLTGGHESKFTWLQFASMPIPAIAVFIVSNISKEPFAEIEWNKFPISWLPLALFLMPAAIHIVCLPLIRFLNNGSLPWQLWLTANKAGLYQAPDKFGWGKVNLGGLASKIVINAITGVVVVTILAFLEEIGWRAWMLPRLVVKFNVRKGVLSGALIWALWHVPFILSGISYVEGLQTYLILLISPFGIFGAGLVINWFWIRTKSIWIVSIAHGALNNWGQYAFKYMQDNTRDSYLQQSWLFVGVNSSLLIIGLIIFSTMRNKHQK